MLRGASAVLLTLALGISGAVFAASDIREFPVPSGSHPHDVAPDGGVWYTAQNSGELGWLNPKTGEIKVFDAPCGSGPYGICTAPDGNVYHAWLAGAHIARMDTKTGAPPSSSRRPNDRAPVACGPTRKAVSGRAAGTLAMSAHVGMYDPKANRWREWKLSGDAPRAYAVYVDNKDIVWLSDFDANAVVRFDPKTEKFTVYPLPSRCARAPDSRPAGGVVAEVGSG